MTLFARLIVAVVAAIHVVMIGLAGFAIDSANGRGTAYSYDPRAASTTPPAAPRTGALMADRASTGGPQSSTALISPGRATKAARPASSTVSGKF